MPDNDYKLYINKWDKLMKTICMCDFIIYILPIIYLFLFGERTVNKTGVAVHAYNPRTWRSEQRNLEFKARQENIPRPSLKTTEQIK